MTEQFNDLLRSDPFRHRDGAQMQFNDLPRSDALSRALTFWPPRGGQKKGTDALSASNPEILKRASYLFLIGPQLRA